MQPNGAVQNNNATFSRRLRSAPSSAASLCPACAHWRKSCAGPGSPRSKALLPLYKKNRRLYLKRPFGGPEQVLAYLANYTHRVAIANSRIREIDEATGKVTIIYRDYADGAKIKLLKLSGTEFIRRFSLHLLPPRFTKIRHYGILPLFWPYKLADLSVARSHGVLRTFVGISPSLMWRGKTSKF